MLRRALEDALETGVASTVLFEALDAAGTEVPRTAEEVLAVVRGPLLEALKSRIDEYEAALLISRIQAQLEPEPSTVEVPLEEFVARSEREDATAQILTLEGAVKVFVLSAGRSFARRLLTSLGEHRVDPFVASHPSAWPHPQDPAIVLLDASDFPACAPGAVVAWADELPASVACVVWGSDLPYGKNFAKAIEGASRDWLTLELDVGIAPFLDLVRSRRKRSR